MHPTHGGNVDGQLSCACDVKLLDELQLRDVNVNKLIEILNFHLT